MGDPKGFLKTARETPRRRPVDVRIRDWREVYEPFASERTERQAARDAIARDAGDRNREV